MSHTTRARLAAIVLVAAWLGAGITVAQAEPGERFTRGASTIVTTDPDGVTVGIDGFEQRDLSTGAPTGGGGGGSSCTYSQLGPNETASLGEPPSGTTWYIRECKGGVFEILALPGGSPGPQASVDPYLLALSVRRRIPAPNVTVGARPSRALTGMETWLWLEGYNGQPLRASESLLGTTVDVEANPTRYLWDFGDGSRPLRTSSTGRAWPARSEITHTYERASTGYKVQVAFDFDVRWRANGGAWQRLDPITRTATSTLPVAQSQAVLR